MDLGRRPFGVMTLPFAASSERASLESTMPVLGASSLADRQLLDPEIESWSMVHVITLLDTFSKGYTLM